MKCSYCGRTSEQAKLHVYEHTPRCQSPEDCTRYRRAGYEAGRRAAVASPAERRKSDGPFRSDSEKAEHFEARPEKPGSSVPQRAAGQPAEAQPVRRGLGEILFGQSWVREQQRLKTEGGLDERLFGRQPSRYKDAAADTDDTPLTVAQQAAFDALTAAQESGVGIAEAAVAFAAAMSGA